LGLDQRSKPVRLQREPAQGIPLDAARIGFEGRRRWRQEQDKKKRRPGGARDPAPKGGKDGS